MQLLRSTVFIAVLGAVTACASTPAEVETPMRSTQTAVQEVPTSGLGPQELAAGECGLFLWSKTDTTKFIFFSQAVTGSAIFKPEDEILQLEQVAAGGTIFGQFNTEQGYRASDGSTVELSFEPGDELSGGQRVSDGLMTVTDAEGWRTKLPVLGIRACMPEA